jgi:hypothetical protein
MLRFASQRDRDNEVKKGGVMKTMLAITLALVLILSVTQATTAEAEDLEVGEVGEVIQGQSIASEESTEYGVGTIDISTKCGSTITLAITNRVATTIKTPFNVGACAFTLRCRSDGSNRGLPIRLSPNRLLQSFSCGTDAARIVLIADGDEGQAVIRYVP